MRALLPLLIFAGCRAFPCAEDELLTPAGDCVPWDPGGASPDDSAPDDSAPDDSAPDDSAPDDSAPIEWSTLPAACEAPAELGADDLTMIGFNKRGQDGPGSGFFVELVDLELHGDTAYGVGQGGLLIYDLGDPTQPALVSNYPADGHGRFHRVEVLGEGLVAVTHRDQGLQVLDVSDPQDIQPVHLRSEAGLEGLAWVDPYLVLTDRGAGVLVLDLSDPARPQDVTLAPGLSAPWELSPPVDGWSYVADNTLGVVPVDLRDPTQPVIGGAVSVPGAVQHTAVDGAWLYAATGAGGVAIFDRSDPAAPALVGTVDTGGSATQVAVADGVLWVVDHEGVAVFDVSDPREPRPLAHEQTEQFALAVRARSGREAWVGDWNILSGWSLAESPQFGALDPQTDTLRLPEGGGEALLTLVNRGAGPLTLSGAAVADPRVRVEASAQTLASGESAWLRLGWEGGGSLDTTLCLASDDPDGPVQTLALTSGAVGDYLGQTAPDFALPTLDGDTLQLSEQLGYPVLLVYFATW